MIFFCSLARSTCLDFFSLSFNFTLCSAETANSTVRQVLFFRLPLGVFAWPRLSDMFVSGNPREFRASRSPGRIPIVQILHVRMGKFQFLAQFPMDNLPHQLMFGLILFALICCIHLLWDWSFCLYHHITYISYFDASILCFNILGS